MFSKFNHAKFAILALIIANTIWGASPPIFKWALQDVGPFTLAFFRFGLAALVFLPITWGQYRIARRDIYKIILMAFFGITINISFFFWGLQLAPSINMSIIGSTGPIFIIIGSLVFLKEKVKGKVLLGTMIGLIGVLSLIFIPFFRGSEHHEASLGDVLFVVSVLGVVIQTLLAREMLKKYLATTITFWSFAIGTLFFTPFFAAEVATRGFLPNFGFQAAFGIIFGAFLSSCLAYYLFYYALRYLTAAEVSIFVYIDPVVTVLIAFPLLGEVPDATFLIGALLVFGGIFISEGRIHWHPLHLLKRVF